MFPSQQRSSMATLAASDRLKCYGSTFRFTCSVTQHRYERKVTFRPFKKVRVLPLVRQLTPYECGPACLTMIARYYGLGLSLEGARECCEAGRDGINARILVSSARTLGLPMNGYKLEPQDLLKLSQPAILHWRFDHFVVFEKATAKGVHICDPARGRLRVSFTELNESFTGVALLCSDVSRVPTSLGQSPRKHAHSARLISAVFIKKWGLCAQLLSCSLILQLFGLLFPLCLRVALNHTFLHSQVRLSQLGFLIALFASCFFAATLIKGICVARLKSALDETLATTFLKCILDLPYVFTQQRPVGDLLVRLESNRILRDFALGTLITVALDTSLAGGYIVFLLWASAPVGTLVVGATVAQMICGLLAAGWTSRALNVEITAQGRQHGLATETLQNLPLVKASGAEVRILTRWRAELKDQLMASEERGLITALSEGVLATLRLMTPPLALLISLQRHLHGITSVSDVVAISFVAGMLTGPVSSILFGLQQLSSVRLHALRVDDILGGANTLTREGQVSVLARPRGDISATNLSYRFTTGGPLLLRDISLRCDAGTTVGLVGPTGSGKSTLMSLLAGLYTPSAGETFLDNCPIQRFVPSELRKHIGIVFQESFFFSGTLRENFVLIAGDTTDERILHSCWVAGLDSFVDSLPMGLDTIISSWNTVSGGERQRLAIARAIVSDPVVLFLDEATSHLDVITEAIVHQRLSLMRCTRIIIAHRLQTIQDADVIYVLQDGHITGSGSHGTLLTMNPYYRKCVASQGNDKTCRAE